MFIASYVVLWILLLGVSVLVLLLYRHFGLMAMDSLPGVQRDGLPVGEEAPEIDVITPEGRLVHVTPGESAPTLLLFAAPHCAPCKEVAPYVSRLHALSAVRHGLDVVVIARGGADVATTLSESFGGSTPAFGDNGNGFFDDYRVRVTPFAFVVDLERRVRAKGLCGDARRLRELLAGAGMEDAAACIEDDLNEFELPEFEEAAV